jgi:tRNA(fMet)-specific endonuclease VapC
MLRYLLHTNALIALLRGGANPVAQRIRAHTPSEIAMSSIAMRELHYGAYRNERLEHNLDLVDGLLLEGIDRECAQPHTASDTLLRFMHVTPLRSSLVWGKSARGGFTVD